MGDAARFDARFRSRLPRILLASLVMGAALWGGTLLLGPMLGIQGWRYAGLAALVAIGIAAYAAAGLAIGAFRIADFRAALSRQR